MLCSHFELNSTFSLSLTPSFCFAMTKVTGCGLKNSKGSTEYKVKAPAHQIATPLLKGKRCNVCCKLLDLFPRPLFMGVHVQFLCLLQRDGITPYILCNSGFPSPAPLFTLFPYRAD